jgi:hypothetical protein
MSEWPVTLVPYTEDWLAAVRPWFTHPEVRRRLGGPDWPERELRQPADLGEIFRGRRVLRVHSWVALILFALGIEPDNVASRRCAESAGFVPDDPEPDWEDIVHHLLRRPSRQVRD